MPARFPNRFYLNALVYPEEGEYVAHCLEMDLVGFGSTPEKAIEDLDDHVDMQVSFARQMKNPDLLWHPAPPSIQKIFWDLFEKRIKGLISSLGEKDWRPVQIPYPNRIPKNIFEEACV